MTDLRVALRQLLRRPGLSLLIGATLAVGIGINTAIFSASWAGILRAPPFDAPHELQLVTPLLRKPTGVTDTLGVWSYPMFTAFREATPDLAQLAAYTPSPLTFNLSSESGPDRVLVEMVSGMYFGVLGVGAALGRPLTADDDQPPGDPAVAVLSHMLWQRRFGGDPAVIGRSVQLNTVTVQVVGVAPQGFRGLSEQAELWTPMLLAPELTFARRLTGVLSFWHAVVVRVPEAVSAEVLTTWLDRSGPAVADRVPVGEAFGGATLGFTARSLAEARTNPSVRSALLVLTAAIACVLLIIVVNVTGLLLTRAMQRRGEFGLRVALGARPRHLARVLVLESVLLGLAGGLGGLLVASWGVSLIRMLAPALPAGTPDLARASLGLPVLVFNFGVALLLGLVAGLWPVRAALRQGPSSSLAAMGRQIGDRGRWRSWLVPVEIALALVLLTGAGLMLRSLQVLSRADTGFQPEGLLTAGLTLPRQAYRGEAVPQFLDAALERARALPGVTAASVANCLPLVGGCDRTRMVVAGRTASPDAAPADIMLNLVDPGYFRTLGIPLLAGRPFGTSDRAGTQRVAILSRAAAHQYWPDGDALGARMQLTLGWEDDAEIIGVVGDVSTAGVDAPAEPVVYLPYAQMAYGDNYLVLRTGQDAAGLVEPLRAAIRGLDAGLPLWDVRTMDARVAGSFSQTRFTATLLSIAAGLALFLAALGVFGVMAFAVAARTRELGLRVALGARPRDVMRLVLRQGVRATGIGLLAGGAGAFLLARLLSPQLRGISWSDPVAFLGGAAVLLLAGGLAAWLPARSAIRIQPMEALRHD